MRIPSIPNFARARRGFWSAPLVAPVLVLALALGACSSSDDEIPVYIERPPEDIYNEALFQLDQENYTDAARLFDEVERQHPYSPWATRAQLMSAYSSYVQTDYDGAINAADRFIALHPGNPEIAYAYYLKALAWYDQIVDVERDQRVTQNALAALTEVVNRFPATDYARDAKLKIDLANDQLAGKEMTIGRFYMVRGQYTAAIGRFRRVVEFYQTTSQVPEALHRLTECYLALGLIEEAQRTASVLAYNYPGSEWYLDSYAILVDPSLRPESGGTFDWLF